MPGPVDPLKNLHDEMLNRDMLSSDTRDFETFSKKLADPAGRKRLYDVLAKEGWGVHGYEDFEKSFFSVPDVKKKDDTASGPPSSPSGIEPIDASAPTADIASSQPIPGNAPNSLLRQFSSPGGPEPTAQGGLDLPQVLSKNDDPIKVGSLLRQKVEKDFDFKEKRASETPLRRGQRDIENISLYAQAAAEQSGRAEKNIASRLGKDWQQEMANYMAAINIAPENAADVAYLTEANDFLAAIQADPDFKLWQESQQALQKSQGEFQNYAKKNPAYAKDVATTTIMKAMADSNPQLAIGNWGVQKSAQILGGVASLPRTLLGSLAKGAGSVGTFGDAGEQIKSSAAYKWAQDMGDWADNTIEKSAMMAPTGSGTNRPMWERMAEFDGAEVVVDDAGNPVKAFKGNEEIPMSDAFTKRFVESGAAQKAERKFTGAKNTVFKLADTVADLYIMRYLGGGSMAGTTAVAFGMQHQDAYNTAINDLNLKGDDASLYALVSAGLSATIEATIGNIETKPLKLAAAKAVGLKEAKALVGKASVYDVAKASWRPYLESIASENVEEVVDNMSQALNNQMFNAMTGSALDTSVSPQEMAETVIMTTLATAIAGGGDAMREGHGQMYSDALNVAVQNPDAFYARLPDLVSGGVLTEEQAQSQKNRIGLLSKINESLPSDISEEKRQEIIALQDRRISVSETKVESPAQEQAVKKVQKEIDNQIVNALTKNDEQQADTNENKSGTVSEPSQNETSETEQVAGDTVNTDSVQPVPETSDTETADQNQPIVEEDALINVFNNGFSDNPFEQLATEDRTKERRTVTQQERVDNNVPELTNVVTRRDMPVQSVLEAYTGDVAQQAIVDDAVNLALNSMMPAQRNQVLESDGLFAALENNIARNLNNEEWRAQNSEAPFVPVVESMAQDFVDQKLGPEKAKNLRDRFEPVTVEDHIAAAFAEGVKIRPQDVSKNIAEMKDGGVRVMYTSRNGTSIDLLAQDILDRMGQNADAAVDMNEQDVISAIYQFINDNPKGTGEYMKETIARRAMVNEESVGEVEAIEQKDVAEAVDTVAELSPAEEAELESFLDSYGDNMEQLLDDWENWDPFEPGEVNDKINALSTNIFNIIDGKLRTIKQSASEETSETVQSSEEQVSEQSGDGQEQVAVPKTSEGFDEEVARVNIEQLGPVDGTAILPIPQITMNETGGVVTNASGFADLLSDAGAKFDSAAGGWTFNADQLDAVNIALSSRRTDGGPVFDAVNEVIQDVGLGGQVKSMLTTPGAIVFSGQTERKLAAANNLDDRLAIARAQHQLSRARDERTIRRTLKRLQKAFPDVEIVTDTTLIERAKAAMGVSGPVMGFSYDGKVYVDMRYARPDTPIHEFGHVWAPWLKKADPAMHKKGEDLARQSDLFQAVKANPAYANLSEEEQLEETMARAIGEQGALMGDTNLVVRFKRWLSDMWSGIQRSFGFQPQFMTLREFADYHAASLLSGKELMPETKRRIKQLETQKKVGDIGGRFNDAVAMELHGIDSEQIFYATGWSRGSDGFWRYGIDSTSFALKVDEQSDIDMETATVGDVLDWPGLFQQFPEVASMPISEVGNPMDASFVFDLQGKIIESLGIPPASIPAAVTDEFYAERNMDGRLTQPGLTDMAPEEGHVFQGTEPPPAKFQVAAGSADYASRIATARVVIEAQIKAEGLKNVDTNIAKIADQLNLDLEHVKRLWESELAKAATGKIVLTKADLNKSEATLREKFLAGERMKKGKIKQWLKKKFLPMGLMPEEMFNLDQKRLGKIASRVKDGEYLLADLEDAMKKAYGTPNEAQWQHVDNVMRGLGDWSTLPDEIRGAAKAIRIFMDNLSRDLVRSGVMKGDVILTVLQNSGTITTKEELSDWNGVNVYRAIGKLPFERSAVENAAIEDFLSNQQNAIGTYFYRSYRKYDDTEWINTVRVDNPRVWAEAKAFLEDQYKQYMADIEQERTDKIEVLNGKIDQVKADIQTIQDGINEDIEELKGQISEIEEKQSQFVAERGRRNKVTDSQYGAANKALKVLEKRAKEVAKMSLDDAEALMALSDPAFQNMSVAAKQIVKKRREIIALQNRIEAAKNFKQAKYDQYLQNSQNVEGKMLEILDIEDSPSGQLSRSKLGGKDNSILRARKDIAEPIRELMGEYHDPRVNFAKSMFRAVNLLENQKFLTDLRENYAGTYFIPPTELREGFFPISSEGSQTMAPLNGWKTTKEIRDVLNNYFAPSNRATDLVSQAYNWYTKFVSTVKYGKTILSPVTHFRNFVGNLFFVTNNAYNPFTSKSFIAFKDAWTNMSDVDSRDYVKKLIELRVLNNGSYIGSIRELLNTMNSNDVDQFIQSKLGTFSNKLRKGIEETYGAEDDFFRIIAFETEKSRYSKALYGQEFESLTPAQKESIEKKAAELAVALLPTYSMIPEIAKDIQKFPLTGTFIAFPAEMFRVTVNQYKQIGADLSDPRTRGIGMQRLVGAAIAQIGLTAGVTALGHWLSGIDWDDDKAARRFMFPWQDNGVLLYLDYQPGQEIRFVNTSYTNPYSFQTKPLAALFLNWGKTWQEKVGEAAWNIVEPFLSPELTASAIGQLAYNVNERTGRPIYNPGLGPIGDFGETTKFLVWNLQPGISKTALDLGSAMTGKSIGNRTPKELSDVLLGFVGLQVERMKIEKAVASDLLKRAKEKTYARDVFTMKKYDLLNDPEALRKRYDLSALEYNDALQEVGHSVTAARVLGLSPQILDSILKDRGFSSAERAAIYSGSKIMPKFEGYNK